MSAEFGLESVKGGSVSTCVGQISTTGAVGCSEAYSSVARATVGPTCGGERRPGGAWRDDRRAHNRRNSRRSAGVFHSAQTYAELDAREVQGRRNTLEGAIGHGGDVSDRTNGRQVRFLCHLRVFRGWVSVGDLRCAIGVREEPDVRAIAMADDAPGDFRFGVKGNWVRNACDQPNTAACRSDRLHNGVREGHARDRGQDEPTGSTILLLPTITTTKTVLRAEATPIGPSSTDA